MPDQKLTLSRPRDESLQAYKDWIMELTTRMTGKTESTMTESEWEDLWKDFWTKNK